MGAAVWRQQDGTLLETGLEREQRLLERVKQPLQLTSLETRSDLALARAGAARSTFAEVRTRDASSWATRSSGEAGGGQTTEDMTMGRECGADRALSREQQSRNGTIRLGHARSSSSSSQAAELGPQMCVAWVPDVCESKRISASQVDVPGRRFWADQRGRALERMNWDQTVVMKECLRRHGLLGQPRRRNLATAPPAAAAVAATAAPFWAAQSVKRQHWHEGLSGVGCYR